MNFLRILLGMGIVFFCGNLTAQELEKIPPRLVKLCEQIESLEEEIADMEDVLSKVDSLLEVHAQAQIILDMAHGGKPVVIDAPKLPGTPMPGEKTAQIELKAINQDSNENAVIIISAQQKESGEDLVVEVSRIPDNPKTLAVPEKAAPVSTRSEPVEPARETTPASVGEDKVVEAESVAPETEAVETKQIVEAEPDSINIEQKFETEPAESVPQITVPAKDLKKTWAALKKGMSEKDLVKLMGEPDKITDRVFDFWTYVTSEGNSGYVYIDKGRVTGWREPHISP